jgi:hypothetical protein
VGRRCRRHDVGAEIMRGAPEKHRQQSLKKRKDRAASQREAR